MFRYLTLASPPKPDAHHIVAPQDDPVELYTIDQTDGNVGKTVFTPNDIVSPKPHKLNSMPKRGQQIEYVLTDLY